MHRLVSGRRLVLGGVTIDYEKGLLGHSDADVLVHAVCDALLGAIAAGDIGDHFPDTDPAYKDADSMNLLKAVREIVAENGYVTGNIDATVFAQKPKISPYKAEMTKNLAAALRIDPGCINVKATTTEKLGPIGRSEGIAALCTALVCQIQKSDA